MTLFIYRYEAMSTPCELKLYARSQTEADRAAHAALRETKRLEKKYNYFASDSYLSQINRREISVLDFETQAILKQSLRFYQLTHGIFDVTIGTLKQAYEQSRSNQQLSKAVEGLDPYIGMHHLKIKHRKIYFDNPYTQIDLGGFVKEFAVDRVAVLLKEHNISNALINYGGDMFAIGKKPDGNQFVVGIKNPENPDEVARFVSIEDQAITTSASYERGYCIGGENFSHIISTQIQTSDTRSVSVISPSCIQSGVFSTALMIKEDLAVPYEYIFV